MKKYFALLFVVIVLVNGCNINELELDNIQAPALTGSFAAPLGHVSYTVRELLQEVGDSLDYVEDSTSLIKLVFRDTTEFNSGSDIIELVNVQDTSRFSPDTVLVNNTGSSVVISRSRKLFFDFPTGDGDPIDSIFYTSGELSVAVSTDMEGDFSYDLSIGNTVNINTGLPATFSSASNNSLDLANHKMLLEDTTVNGFKVDFNYNVTLQDGQEITANNQVTLSINYLDQEYSIVYGFFGQDIINVGSNTIDVSFFEDLGGNGFIFEAPEITLDFENSYGVPMGFLFSNFYAIKNQDTTNLTGPVTSNPQIVLAPGLDNVGGSITSQTVINGNNSSLPDLLKKAPGAIGLDMKAQMNPQSTSVQNFILNTSLINVYSTIEIPMSIQMNEVTQTQDFKLGDGLNFEAADSASIRIVAVNEIPFSVLLDLELYNEGDTLLYANRFNRVIETPFLNVDGSLKQPRKNIADIDISGEGIDALREATKMVIVFSFNTPESQTSEDIYVKLLADAKIDLTISAIVVLTPEF